MPKIFQMQSLPKLVKKVEVENKKYYAPLPLAPFEDSCVCKHKIISHRDNGECALGLIGLCDCKKPIPANFDFVIEITNADIFEFENNQKLERDSFEWYNEFNLWEIRNENR